MLTPQGPNDVFAEIVNGMVAVQRLEMEAARDWKAARDAADARENEPDIEEPGEEEPPLAPPEGWETATRPLRAVVEEMEAIARRAGDPQSIEDLKADVRRAVELMREAEQILGGR